MSKEKLELADRIDGSLPQLVTDVDKNEKADAYRLVLSLEERKLLSAALRASAVAEPTPTKAELAQWSRAWSNTCNTILEMLGLPGHGSPDEMIAQVSSYISAHPAPAAPVPAGVREALELARSAFHEQGVADRVPITLGRIERALASLPAPAAAPTREEIADKRPIYVSELARSLALDAFDDIDDEHPEAKTYALARWFDAILALKSAPHQRQGE